MGMPGMKHFRTSSSAISTSLPMTVAREAFKILMALICSQIYLWSPSCNMWYCVVNDAAPACKTMDWCCNVQLWNHVEPLFSLANIEHWCDPNDFWLWGKTLHLLRLRPSSSCVRGLRAHHPSYGQSSLRWWPATTACGPGAVGQIGQKASWLTGCILETITRNW